MRKPSSFGCSLNFLIAALIIVVAVVAWLLWPDSRTALFEQDSPFGRVRVTEERDGLRALYTGEGRGRQTALYPDRPTHLVSEYTRVGMIGLALVPGDARILFVGLGGGAMPTYTRRVRPEAMIDVVEIDPVIVDVAQRYFGFIPDDRMRVHTGDGRAFIEQAAPGSWDLIVLDAFSDDEIPRALATLEFLEGVQRALSPDGVVVSNLWTANTDFGAMISTYEAVFERVHLLRVPRRRQQILVSGPGVASASQATLAAAAEDLQRRAELGFDLRQLVQSGYVTDPFPAGPLIEDDPSR